MLEDIQFGGKRNDGDGTTTLKDTQLTWRSWTTRVSKTAFILELVTPFVLESECPTANTVDVVVE